MGDDGLSEVNDNEVEEMSDDGLRKMDDIGLGEVDDDGLREVDDDGLREVDDDRLVNEMDDDGLVDEMDEDSDVDNDSNNDNGRFKWIKNNKDEDFRGIGLSDAYEDLHNEINPIQTLWPSEVYKEFMTAVTQHHLSDAAADSMLRIIRKYCAEPLPSSTRKGKMYMDQMDIKDFNIKTKDLIEFEGKVYKLQYRPVFDAIKSLVSNSDLSKNFLFDYKEQWEYDDVSQN
jgi:hypothetical protein